MMSDRARADNVIRLRIAGVSDAVQRGGYDGGMLI